MLVCGGRASKRSELPNRKRNVANVPGTADCTFRGHPRGSGYNGADVTLWWRDARRSSSTRLTRGGSVVATPRASSRPSSVPMPTAAGYVATELEDGSVHITPAGRGTAMTVNKLYEILGTYLHDTPNGGARDVQLVVEGQVKPLAIADLTGVFAADPRSGRGRTHRRGVCRTSGIRAHVAGDCAQDDGREREVTESSMQFCGEPGCGVLVSGGRCPAHARRAASVVRRAQLVFVAPLETPPPRSHPPAAVLRAVSRAWPTGPDHGHRSHPQTQRGCRVVLGPREFGRTLSRMSLGQDGARRVTEPGRGGLRRQDDGPQPAPPA